MKQIAKMYGSAMLYGLCLIMVLVMVFQSVNAQGNDGMLVQIGQIINVPWEQDDAGGFAAYAAESSEEFPEIVCRVSGALATGTYDVNEVVAASDGAGNALECRVKSIRYPKQEEFIESRDLQLIFDKPGVYELKVSVKDSENRETVRYVAVPVNK